MRAPLLCGFASLLLLTAGPSAVADTDYEELRAGDGTFLIEWRGDFTGRQQAKLRQWLGSVAETVSLLHGNLPRSPIRIVLQAYPAKSAVPFARVLRSPPEGIHFYINPERPLEEFVRDWTAYHEMSHLFIPYPGQRSIWFSEGMASYYQNVLQFRAGLLTEQQAWQKLYNGFERGRQDSRGDGMTLGELSAAMRKTHAYMRIYWSGALYFLEADIALREHSDGQMTLDEVLREYGACCLAKITRTNGRELAQAFDDVAGADIFVPLYEDYDASSAIPNFQAVLNAAGVEIVDGQVQLDAEDPPIHALQPR